MSDKNRKTGTNSIGKGKINLTVHITEDLRDQLGGLAEKTGKRIGEYCRAILEDAARRGLIVRESQQIQPLNESEPRSNSVSGSQGVDERAASGLGQIALTARGLKPPTGAPSDGTASPSNGGQKRPGPRPKLPTQAPK